MENKPFECSVCLEELPSYIMPCGHSGCEICIKKLKNCPECRLKLPAQYVPIKNFAFIYAMEKIENLSKSSKKDENIFWDSIVKSPRLIANIQKANWSFPTLIQQSVVPKIKSGRNFLIESPNGTGKTGSFVIGTLNNVNPSLIKIQIISISHTKEIKDMHCSIFEQMSEDLNICVYKTVKNSEPLNSGRGIQVLCGTLDSVRNFILRYCKSLNDVCIIVDECDEILSSDIGRNKLSMLLKRFSNKQVLLYSATLSQECRKFNESNELFCEEISVQAPETLNEKSTVFNFSFSKSEEKSRFIVSQLKYIQFSLCIIFVNTRDSAYSLAELTKKGYRAAFYSGDLDNDEREETLSAINAGKISVLVCTDLLGRGFDYRYVDLVINFSCPFDVSNRKEPNYSGYFHRCGRTSRNNRPGTIINLIDKSDLALYNKVFSRFKINSKYENSIENVIQSIEENSTEYKKFL